VDEDQDARSAGVDVLSALLSQLQEKIFKPFGTLLIARVSSALHSLDASTRIDGVKMVKLVSTACPSLTAVSIDRLLPPFVGLLADQRTRKGIDDILQSLISLLRVTETKYSGVSDSVPTSHITPASYAIGDVKTNRKRDHQPDLIYISGGRSRNAILRSGRSVHALQRTIESVSQLSCLEHTRLTSRDGRGIKYRTNVMAKLRDSLIESINLENEPAMSSANRMIRSSTIEPRGSMNYSRIILLLRSIRYLHKNFTTRNAGYFDDDENDFDKFTQQVVSVLMDIFPVDHDPSPNSATKDGKSSSTDDVNAAIAITILDITHEPRTNTQKIEKDNAKQCMKAIYSYVIPRIDHLADTRNANSSSDVDITCKFLRRLGAVPVFSADLISILGILQDLFFHRNDIALARSNAGRRISLMVMDLIEVTDFSVKEDSKSKIFLVFLQTMPFYLEAWDVDFIYESERILKGLVKSVREVKEVYNASVLESIRDNWHKLVEDCGDSSSIFERYPWHLQRKWLGMVVLLRNPSDQTLCNLASICGRSKKQAVSQAIVEAIQDIRKTVPMQRYLAFLLQSVGISCHVKKLLRFEASAANRNLDQCSKNVFDKVFFEIDPGLDRVARALVEPGSLQVLQMILPQLSSWQYTVERKVEEATRSMEFLLKTRASYIILAYFFTMLSSKEKNQQLADHSSIFDLTNGVMTVDRLNYSICRFIRCIVQNEEAIEFYSKLTSPIIAIMCSHNVIFSAVILKISDWFQTVELTKIEQKNLVLILVEWVKDPRVKDAMKGPSSLTTMILEQIGTIGRSQVLKDNELVHALIPILNANS